VATYETKIEPFTIEVHLAEPLHMKWLRAALDWNASEPLCIACETRVHGHGPDGKHCTRCAPLCDRCDRSLEPGDDDGLCPRWHGPKWDATHTPEEEHSCGTAHCLAGWAQALCPLPLVRRMDPERAGLMLIPTAAHMFRATNEDARKFLESKRKPLRGEQYPGLRPGESPGPSGPGQEKGEGK